jgi:hypothetical protein
MDRDITVRQATDELLLEAISTASSSGYLDALMALTPAGNEEPPDLWYLLNGTGYHELIDEAYRRGISLETLLTLEGTRAVESFLYGRYQLAKQAGE